MKKLLACIVAGLALTAVNAEAGERDMYGCELGPPNQIDPGYMDCVQREHTNEVRRGMVKQAIAKAERQGFHRLGMMARDCAAAAYVMAEVKREHFVMGEDARTVVLDMTLLMERMKKAGTDWFTSIEDGPGVGQQYFVKRFNAQMESIEEQDNINEIGGNKKNTDHLQGIINKCYVLENTWDMTYDKLVAEFTEKNIAAIRIF